MAEHLQLRGKSIYLRTLDESDASDRYVQWLNDPETNRYLESRFSVWTAEELRAYIKDHRNESEYFFAICLLENNAHVGNIKLGPIDAHHLNADIGIMIGDKACRGMRIGTEAIQLLTNFAFKKIKLQKLTAGAYVNNVASINAFEKCGFTKEGHLKDHVYSDGKRVDAILLGYTAKDFLKKNLI